MVSESECLLSAISSGQLFRTDIFFTGRVTCPVFLDCAFQSNYAETVPQITVITQACRSSFLPDMHTDPGEA
jgi:hypothetical protein